MIVLILAHHENLIFIWWRSCQVDPRNVRSCKDENYVAEDGHGRCNDRKLEIIFSLVLSQVLFIGL